MSTFQNQQWRRELQSFGHNQGPGLTWDHAGAVTTKMKDEMTRLASFSKAPALPPNLSSIILAGKGFYYDEKTKRIVCVHCEFSSGIPRHMSDLFDQHRARSPMCKPEEEQKAGRFGQSGEIHSNGVTKRWPTPRPHAATFQWLSSSGDELFDEEEPSINDDELYGSGPQRSGSPPELSRLDLHWNGPIGRWTTVTSMGECSVPISTFLSSQSATERIHERPIFDARNAKIRGFETYESRLSSFDLWPEGKRPTKEELADCGFIFIADGMCQCFSCELVLHEWKENDDVWKEHAKYSGDCEYVLFRKGEDFVSSVRNEVSAPGFRDERISQSGEGSVEDERGSESIYPVERRDVTARLDWEMARYVMSMGYSEDEVGSVIQERLMQTGKDFQSTMEMVKVLEDIRNKSRPPPSVQFHRRLANSGGTTSASVSNPGSLGYSHSSLGTPSSQSVPSMENGSNEEFTMAGHEQTTVKSPPIGPHVNSSGDLREINEENEELQDLELCSLCVDRDRDTVFIPCHHLICCRACADRLRECPICRERITNLIVVNE